VREELDQLAGVDLERLDHRVADRKASTREGRRCRVQVSCAKVVPESEQHLELIEQVFRLLL
jgi:hypothetical protein